jgi:MFS family permease
VKTKTVIKLTNFSVSINILPKLGSFLLKLNILDYFAHILKKKYPALNNDWMRAYITCQIISYIGGWMQSVSLPLLALSVSNDLTFVGLIGAVQVVPLTLFGVFTGTISDSLPKRKIVLTSQLGFCLLALFLACTVLTKTINKPILFLIALCIGIFSVINQSAQATLYAEILKKKHVQNASALSFMVYNFSRVFGPVLASLIIWKFGFFLAFLLNSVSFLPMIFLFYNLSSAFEGVKNRFPKPSDVIRKTKDGFQYVVSQKTLFEILYKVTFMGIFGFNFSVLLPSLIKWQFEASEQTYGTMVSALGLGSLLGAILAAEKRGDRLYIDNISRLPYYTGFLLFVLAISKHLILAALIMTLIGIVNILFFSKARGILHAKASSQFIGRVDSIYGLCFAGMSPIGNSIAGLIGGMYGASTGFLIMGSLLVGFIFIGQFILKLGSNTDL